MKKYFLTLIYIFLIHTGFSQDEQDDSLVYIDAIKMWDNEIKLNPKDTVSYYQRGKSKFKLQDFEGALKDFNKVIELNPNYPKVEYYRSLAIEKIRTKPKFIRVFYISNVPKIVPPNKVWEVVELIINKTTMENKVILYDKLGYPNTYNQIITFCDSCDVCFGSFEDASLNQLFQTIDDGYYPIMPLPLKFPAMFKLYTKNDKFMIKVKEWEVFK